MSAQTQRSGVIQRHRSKWIGFIIAEAAAVAVLLLAGTFAVLSRLSDSALALSVNVVTVAAAAAVALIPIIFFAIAPILPRADR
jgi:hypothetical protein